MLVRAGLRIAPLGRRGDRAGPLGAEVVLDDALLRRCRCLSLLGSLARILELARVSRDLGLLLVMFAVDQVPLDGRWV
jgi:hypothetical protein